MIKRIKKITQVGVFKNFTGGGAVPLGDKPISLIFGLNTKGKSTLAAIFQSISEDDPSYVVDRMSIPPDGSLAQEIDMSYSDSDGTEKNLLFKDGAWHDKTLKGKVLVFDQDFIHRNVITGDAITRDNKEHFTDFVLGTEGVKLSDTIREDNKNLRTLKGNLRNFRPKHVKFATNDKDVDDFINLKVTESKEYLSKLKEAEEKRLARLENLEKFKNLKNPEAVADNFKKSIDDAIIELDDILRENYSGVSEDAWAALNIHRSENCDGEDAVVWLKKGLEINKSDRCPYCGQSLLPAKDLIDAYQRIFDVKFDEYETALNARIDTLRANIRSLTVFSSSGLISSFIKSAEPFNLYVPEIEEQIRDARTDIDNMTIEEQSHRNTLVLWQAEADNLLRSKEKSIHKSLANTSNHKHVDDATKTLVTSNSKLIAITQDITKHIENTQKKINKYTPEMIANEIAKYKKSISDYEMKINRIEQEDEALEYAQKVNDIETLAKKIKNDTQTLETEQSLYLESYFERVNHWFRHLGSTGFQIERDTKNNGDKKVYSLKLEFNGRLIRPEDINKVFSESDRRNLAFSVFMARAEKMTKKDEIILVMDDPVVSFDDNRIEKTCREIKLISGQYRQIIILTHYNYLLHGMLKNQTNACFVDIKSLSTGSSLAVKDISNITHTAHEKACDRICTFIEGGNDPEIMSVLRPFIEEHLKLVFQKQIRDNGWESAKLSELIDNIHAANLIIDDTKDRLHALRVSLNSGHHNTDTEENIESIRHDAKDVISLLYVHMPERSMV